MALPDDVARCSGFSYDGRWFPDCEDCLRRITPANDSRRVVTMHPPTVFEYCNYYLDPTGGDDGK